MMVCRVFTVKPASSCTQTSWLGSIGTGCTMRREGSELDRSKCDFANRILPMTASLPGTFQENGFPSGGFYQPRNPSALSRRATGPQVMLTADEQRCFAEEQALHATKSLAGTDPRQRSGFGRDARDWERFRRPVVAPIDRDGTFLDIGCANGLLMESVAKWA